MFDENQPNLNPLNNPVDSGPNLPTPPPRPVSPSVDDIFAETDQVNPQIRRPLMPGQAQNILPDTADGEEIFGGRSIWQNKLLITLIILGVLVIASAGWATFYYFANSAKLNPPSANQNQNANVAANLNVNNNNAAVDANVNNNSNVNQASSTTDSDSDGLIDAVEANLGTDPNNFDSDNDGLPDGTEVNVYKTDPLNPDTDGDGYKDGKEVTDGYDPNKPGGARLYDLPQ